VRAAALRGESFDELTRRTTANARRCFGSRIDSRYDCDRRHQSPFRHRHRPGRETPAIRDVAAELGLSDDELELYGKYKAKISAARRCGAHTQGAARPRHRDQSHTGRRRKSTSPWASPRALRRLGKNAILALREPSAGSRVRREGGAAGGGYAQVVPMEDITCTSPAIPRHRERAQPALSAMLDAHLHHGQRPRHGHAPCDLAAHDRHERPRPTQHHRGAGV